MIRNACEIADDLASKPAKEWPAPSFPGRGPRVSKSSGKERCTGKPYVHEIQAPVCPSTEAVV